MPGEYRRYLFPREHPRLAELRGPDPSGRVADPLPARPGPARSPEDHIIDIERLRDDPEVD
jgi:hypothetical protein